MDPKTVLGIVQLAETLLGKGKPGNSPQTVKVNGRDVTVNTIDTPAKVGYQFQWVVGAQGYTVEICADRPLATISGW